jgi:hypothetical protein
MEGLKNSIFIEFRILIEIIIPIAIELDISIQIFIELVSNFATDIDFVIKINYF